MNREEKFPYRPEIEALIANDSVQKFIAKRFGTTEANLSRWLKIHEIKRPKLDSTL